MKKMIFTALLMIFSFCLCYSQKHAVHKLTIPPEPLFISFKEIKKAAVNIPFNKLNIVTGNGTKFQRFISDLPLIKIKETTGKRPFVFFTELSFSDIFENGFKINSGLINTYDNDLPELFKDAPNTVKLRFMISL